MGKAAGLDHGFSITDLASFGFPARQARCEKAGAPWGPDER